MAAKQKPKRITTDKSEANIKRALRELRKLIDETDDYETCRIAQAAEDAIRWATERTVSWPRPVDNAKALADLIHRDRM